MPAGARGSFISLSSKAQTKTSLSWEEVIFPPGSDSLLETLPAAEKLTGVGLIAHLATLGGEGYPATRLQLKPLVSCNEAGGLLQLQYLGIGYFDLVLPDLTASCMTCELQALGWQGYTWTDHVTHWTSEVLDAAR